MRKTSIENVLSWAFIEELPKVSRDGSQTSAPASSAWSTMQELGTLIDASPNAYGVIPSFEQGEVHPDALVIADAVMLLAAAKFDVTAQGKVFADWDDPHGLIAAELATLAAEWAGKVSIQGDHVRHLVRTSAILRRGPDWREDQPEFRMVAKNGMDAWFFLQEVNVRGRKVMQEVDGFDRVKRRPKKGAYRKYELEMPIRGALQMRLDWQLWQMALSHLADQIKGDLQSWSLLTFIPDMAPWIRKKDPMKFQAFESAA